MVRPDGAPTETAEHASPARPSQETDKRFLTPFHLLFTSSAFFKATEEIIAQAFATKRVREGITHAFSGAYKVRRNTVLSKWNYAGEAVPGAIGLGGSIYVGYEVGRWLWGDE